MGKYTKKGNAAKEKRYTKIVSLANAKKQRDYNMNQIDVMYVSKMVGSFQRLKVKKT